MILTFTMHLPVSLRELRVYSIILCFVCVRVTVEVSYNLWKGDTRTPSGRPFLYIQNVTLTPTITK